jgi:hypothetical protein
LKMPWTNICISSPWSAGVYGTRIFIEEGDLNRSHGKWRELRFVFLHSGQRERRERGQLF